MGASKLLESVSKSRKQTQDMLQSVKKIADDIARQEQRRKSEQEKETLSRQYVEAASFMNSFTAEPVELAEKAKRAEEEKAARVAEEAALARKKAEEEAAAKAAETRPPQPARPAQGQGRPAVRPQGQGGFAPRPQGQGQFAARPQGQGQFAARPQGQGQFANRPQGQGQFAARPQGQGGFAPRPQGQEGFGGRPQRQGGFGGRPQGQGGFGGRPQTQGGGFGQKKIVGELAPTVEKDRVSNYDPNKKLYTRQVDPERITKNRRQQARTAAPRGGMDDEVFRTRKRKKQPAPVFKPEPVVIEKAYMTAETITVKDLSERIGKPASEIIKKLLLLGIIANINQELDFDTAQLVCTEFGIEFELKLDKTAEDVLSEEDFEDAEEDLLPRPPVVTIMGHVDHGKTSLLDYIRESRVTASEAGGITQHIGAYTVEIDDRQITFLDTPGHEAFTSMRARGAQATDIAILVVAADDGVMPQTVEAINHAKAAGVQTIVAINKCDKPQANPERIKEQLTEHGLLAEEWGGDTIMVPVSAVTGMGVETLLEMILLVADMQDYKANPNRKARGIIIEARLDRGRGPVATVLIQKGTLRVGDTIVAGTAFGRVRAMIDDKGENAQEAGPSDPVEVDGLNDVPEAGDILSAVDDDRLSRQVAQERKDKLKAALIKSVGKTTLDNLFEQISAGEVKDLNLIVKADVQGSVEAVTQSLEKLTNDEVRVRVIHGAVGAITESDVTLASASNAIIVGFNVRHDNTVRDIAERENVDIRLYRVIYSAIEEIQAAIKGMLAPKFKETILGRAEVRQTFRVTGVGTVAGSYVLDGLIRRNAQARLLRDNIVVHESKVDSLRRFKDDAREVATGYECGIGLANYNDIKEGDIIECFVMEEIAQ